MPSWVSHDFPKMDHPGRNSSFSPGENQENSWFLPGFLLGKACLSAFHQGLDSRFSPGENQVKTCFPGFHQGKCSFPGQGKTWCFPGFPLVFSRGLPGKHQVESIYLPYIYKSLRPGLVILEAVCMVFTWFSPGFYLTCNKTPGFPQGKSWFSGQQNQ